MVRYITKRQVTLATDGAAHADADVVGQRLEFAGVPKFGYIVGAIYHDLADADFDYDLVLFDEAFTATADNSAFDPADASLDNIVAVVRLSEYRTFLDSGVIVTPDAGVRIPYQCVGGTLYGQLVARGAATPDATGNVITLYIEDEAQ